VSLKKKGGSFGKLSQLREQMAALDRQIKIIEALPSPTPYRDTPDTSFEEWTMWNNGVNSVVGSNSIDIGSIFGVDVDVREVDKAMNPAM
jgi:hypothetical protein